MEDTIKVLTRLKKKIQTKLKASSDKYLYSSEDEKLSIIQSEACYKQLLSLIDIEVQNVKKPIHLVK